MTSASSDLDLIDRRSNARPRSRPQGRLAGKVALVAGAGTLGEGWGNGKATAVLFAREGASVVAVDRRREAAEQTAELIKSEGGTSVAIAADVSREGDVDEVVSHALDRYGRIDILHNNVGVGIAKPTLDMSLKEWDTVQRINVTSMFLTIRGVLPHMISQGGGTIVNVSSIASMRWTGVPFVGYAASKAAVNQLTQAIAMEHAQHRIRCNAVVPGFMDTPTVYAGLASDGDPQELREARNRVCPTGAMGDAWDVAWTSLWLASDESAYVTGNLIVVDGGLSLQVTSGRD